MYCRAGIGLCGCRRISYVRRVRDFTKLIVWQRSEILAAQVHTLTRSIVFRNDRSLADQLYRATSAIGALIAEGSGAATRRHYASYLDRAAMTASETYRHIHHARRIRVLDDCTARRLSDEAMQIRRMLVALRNRVLGEND